VLLTAIRLGVDVGEDLAVAIDLATVVRALHAEEDSPHEVAEARGAVGVVVARSVPEGPADVEGALDEVGQLLLLELGGEGADRAGDGGRRVDDPGREAALVEELSSR
jgi:hypothetical protein